MVTNVPGVKAYRVIPSKETKQNTSTKSCGHVVMQSCINHESGRAATMQPLRPMSPPRPLRQRALYMNFHLMDIMSIGVRGMTSLMHCAQSSVQQSIQYQIIKNNSNCLFNSQLVALRLKSRFRCKPTPFGFASSPSVLLLLVFGPSKFLLLA